MKLWTWHEPEFSLLTGRVDLLQSRYYKRLPQAPAAYAQLARHLGTDQIIWCYIHRNEYHALPHLTAIEWALEVPDHEILAIIDAFIWNKILGLNTYPRSLDDKWLADAPVDDAARGAYIDEQARAYHSQPEPLGGWWPQLFIEDVLTEGATVLLRHPIPRSWVVSVAPER